MPAKAVLDAIKAHQQANWTTLPVYYPNSQTKPTADLSAFVTVEFPIGGGERLSYGAQHRDTGTVRFIVHVALASGVDAALTYADELAAVFRSVKFSPDADGNYLETLAPGSPNTLGDNGAFYRVSFSTPYWFWFSA